MPGYAAIELNRRNFGSILASLRDSPGGEARLLEACLRYAYPGDDVRIFFIRGNWRRITSGMFDFIDHIFTEKGLDELFVTGTQKDGTRRPKPGGEWFVIWPKEDDDGNLGTGYNARKHAHLASTG